MVGAEFVGTGGGATFVFEREFSFAGERGLRAADIAKPEKHGGFRDVDIFVEIREIRNFRGRGLAFFLSLEQAGEENTEGKNQTKGFHAKDKVPVGTAESGKCCLKVQGERQPRQREIHHPSHSHPSCLAAEPSRYDIFSLSTAAAKSETDEMQSINFKD
jgi:hypothetical protein